MTFNFKYNFRNKNDMAKINYLINNLLYYYLIKLTNGAIKNTLSLTIG